MVDEWVRPTHDLPTATTVFALLRSSLLARARGGRDGLWRGRSQRRRRRTPSPSRRNRSPARRCALLTHDSFNVSDEVLTAFEQQTGITVELVKGGDAVEVVNQAILTRDNPQGDVLFGIDNNLLTRAYDANLFVPYESPVACVGRPGCAARSRAPSHADRQGRRVPELRSRVLHRRAARGSTDARRPDQAGVRRACWSSRTRVRPLRGSRSCSPRSPRRARTAGRSTGGN